MGSHQIGVLKMDDLQVGFYVLGRNHQIFPGTYEELMTAKNHWLYWWIWLARF
jgi:hypothetical protein